MPKLFRRDGSPHWYFRTATGGRDRWITTGQTDRKQAVAAMERLAKQARGEATLDDMARDMTAELARLDAEAATDKERAKVATRRREIATAILREQAAKVAIVDCWQSFLDAPKKREQVETTLRAYKASWDRFQSWAKSEKIEYLHEITEGHAERYAAALWKTGFAHGTFNAHINALGLVCKTLRRQAGLTVNPFATVERREVLRESRRMLEPDELKAICAKATGAMRYMIAVGLYTGLRLGDAVHLCWENIGTDIIDMIPSKTKRRGKHIRIPIHPVLRVLLDELRSQTKEPNGYLFPEGVELYARDSSIIADQFAGLCHECGIVTTEAGGPHRQHRIVRVGFHSLRHSFVSLCAANRVPQVAIQELVGHGSPAMTALYSHAGDALKTTAIAALPAMTFGRDKG